MNLDNGNREAKYDSANNFIHAYDFNQKNQVARIWINTDGKIRTFTFDPNGYRVSKGIQNSSSKTHYFLEGEHLDAAYDQNNTLKSRYLRGVVVDEIVNAYLYGDNDQYGTNLTYHHDQINSVTALTDHTGAVSEQTSYSAFGEQTSQSGSSTTNILGYTGREHDAEANLIYYRARFYDPEVGRFISEDPLGFEAGVNFYAYVQNNPVMFNDPMGLVDTIYKVGAPGIGIENSPLNGIYNYVEASHGRYPIADNNNNPNDNLSVPIMGFNNVWSERQTTQWIADVVGQNMSVGNVNVYNPFPWGNVTQYSKEGGLWDRKHSLDIGSLYVVDGMAQYRDYVGNMQWAATMELQGAPEAWSKAGANVQALFATHQLDDSRDQNAITAGYNINLNWSPLSSSANGGFVLYPSKPNTNQMRAVYAK